MKSKKVYKPVEKLAMANVVDEENIYISVSDVIEIQRLPAKVKEVIARYSKGMKVLDNGLPASGFIGKSGVKVTGIFRYGEITFISYVGSPGDLQAETLIHLFSNVGTEDYDQMKEFVDGKLKEMEEEK